MEGFQLHYCSMESSLYAKKGKKKKNKKKQECIWYFRAEPDDYCSATKMDSTRLYLHSTIDQCFSNKNGMFLMVGMPVFFSFLLEIHEKRCLERVAIMTMRWVLHWNMKLFLVEVETSTNIRHANLVPHYVIGFFIPSLVFNKISALSSGHIHFTLFNALPYTGKPWRSPTCICPYIAIWGLHIPLCLQGNLT